MLWRDISTMTSFIWATLIACGFIAYLLPLSFLMGHSTVTDYGDISQHISGWWYYMHEPWHFPLLHTYSLDHPEGVSIAFTDSIPIAALFFKLLITFLPNAFPEHFHYFGWWVGFVFVAQAVSATFLIRAMGVTSFFAMLMAVGFALTWPVLHARYHHSALMTQSIILFALAFYFLGQKQGWTSQRTSTAFIALNLIALMVHPYYLAMTASFFIAFLFDRMIKGESWLLQIKRIIIMFALLSLVIWLLGYTRHSAYDALGYGDNGYGNDFFLNLLEPFCGGGKYLACGQGPEYVFPYRESFNYLGAGLLLLIPVAVLLNWKHLRLVPMQSPALSFLLLGFLLYALTNRMHFGEHEFFSYSLPAWTEPLTGTFRAAGRFFWPVSLFILFMTLASLLKRRTWLVSAFLIFALVIQIKDVKPWLLRINTESSTPSKLNFKEWEGVMTSVDKLVIYPIHECMPLHYQHNIWMMRLAGYYGKKINSGYTARGHKDCDVDNASLNNPLLERHLYVISSGAYSDTPFTPQFQFSEPFQQAMLRGECVRRLDDMLCIRGSRPDFWEMQALSTSAIKLVEHGRQWGPAEFSTNIGQTIGVGASQRLVPKVHSKPDHLSFGPFVYLPAGTYRFAINYASATPINQLVGHWDVALENAKTLVSGELFGTNNARQSIEGTFVISSLDAGKPLEIRTYYLAQGDLQLFSTSLQKLP